MVEKVQERRGLRGQAGVGRADGAPGQRARPGARQAVLAPLRGKLQEQKGGPGEAACS